QNIVVASIGSDGDVAVPVDIAPPSPRAIPHCDGASRMPASVNEPCSVTLCPERMLDAVSEAVTTGGRLAMVTSAVAVVALLLSSVTVSVTWYTPLSAYVCAGFASVEVLPSPKSQRYVIG